jgi:hypothetical protein
MSSQYQFISDKNNSHFFSLNPENENGEEKYKNAETIKNKLNVEKERFSSALMQFKKSYILHNKNPNYDEYTNIYASDKTNIEKIDQEVATIQNQLESSIKKLDSEILDLDKRIKREKIENRKFLGEIRKLKNGETTSNIMLLDEKDKYNQLYFYNISVLLCILFVSRQAIMLYRMG